MIKVESITDFKIKKQSQINKRFLFNELSPNMKWDRVLKVNLYPCFAIHCTINNLKNKNSDYGMVTVIIVL